MTRAFVRPLWLALLLIAFTVAYVATRSAAPTSSAGTSPSASAALFSGKPVAAPAVSSGSRPLTHTQRTQLRKAKRKAARRSARLASPRARAERRRSRTAFRGASASQSVAIAEQQHADVIGRETTLAPKLEKGERIETFTSNHAAIIVRKREGQPAERAMVESTGPPIAVRASEAKNVPLRAVDLRLIGDGAAWRPTQAAHPTRLPRLSTSPVELGPLKIGVGGRGVAGQLVGEDGSEKVMYPSTYPDTDALVEPANQGAEFTWFLRSPGAPAELPLAITSDGSAPIAPEIQQDGSALLFQGKAIVGRVTAPSAWDAQGTAVPTRFALRRGVLTVVTPHAGQDVAYPIAIDPLVSLGGLYAVSEEREDLTPWPNTGASILGWNEHTFQTGSFDFGKSWGGAGDHWAKITSKGSGSAWFAFDPVRESAAFRLQMHRVTRDAGPTCLDIGLYRNGVGIEHAYYDTGWAGYWDAGVNVSGPPTGAANKQFTNCGGTINRAYVQACSSGGPCGWQPSVAGGRGATINNLAVFQVGSSGGGNIRHWFEGALVYHREGDAPSIDAFSVNGAADFPTGWTNNDQLSGAINARDKGIGFCSDPWRASLAAPTVIVDRNGGAPLYEGRQTNCDGQTTGVPGEEYIWGAPWNTGGGLGEGPQPVRVRVLDMFGNTAERKATVHVDKTAPTIELDGRLRNYLTERPGGWTGTMPDLASIRTFTEPADLTIRLKDSRSDNIPSSGLDGRDTVPLPDRNVEIGGWVARLDTAGNRIGQPLHLFRGVPECLPARNSCDMAQALRIPWRDASNNPILERLGPGLYQVEIRARDMAGNQTQRAFVFGVGGGRITSVIEGQGTSRWVPLAATRDVRDSFTGDATFQWRAGTLGWADLPGGVLSAEDNGFATVGSTVGAPGGVTSTYVLDLDALRKTTQWSASDFPGKRVFLRARYGTGSEFSLLTEDVAVQIDHGGRNTSDAQEPMGPGSVDLLTGNLTVTSTDAAVAGYQSGLTLDRTYASRYSGDEGLFGPGWAFGLSSTASSGFSKVVDLSDPDRLRWANWYWALADAGANVGQALPEETYPAVQVIAEDGSGITFEEREDTRELVPEAGYESYRLERIMSGGVGTGFRLTDLGDGSTTVFAQSQEDANNPWYKGAPEHGTWGATETIVTGEDGRPSIAYERRSLPVTGPNGQPTAVSYDVPKRVVSSSDAANQCRTTGTLARGCEALDLTVEVVGGKLRLTKVHLTAWDPATSALATKQVATYTYDGSARLYSFTDAESLTTVFGYDGAGLLASLTPAGEAAYRFTYASATDDRTPGRLATIARESSTSSVVYGDAKFGSAVPYDVSKSKVTSWGQSTAPFRAAAVFSAGVSPSTTTAGLKTATISYLDALGRTINVASPDGGISSIDLDKWGNVTRSLTAQGLKDAIASGGTMPYQAQRRASFSIYEPDTRGRVRPIKSVGPALSIDGGGYRRATLTSYDVDYTSSDTGTPYATSDPRMPYNLPTRVRSGMLAADNWSSANASLLKERVMTTVFQRPSRQPLVVKETSAGDDGAVSTRTTKYVRDADGREIERRQPGNADASAAPTTTKTTYYSGGTGTCGGRPEWEGLVCQVEPGGQPTTAGLPKLPVVRTVYDFWRQPIVVTETVTAADGSQKQRITTTTFDDKSRPVARTVTGTFLAADLPPRVEFSYDGSGRPATTVEKNASGTVLRQISRGYDARGRLTSYRTLDGSSVRSERTTTFDEGSRPLVVTDRRNGTTVGTITSTYDKPTGRVLTVTDSGLPGGAMVPAYNADGAVISVTYPSGVRKGLTYDDAGGLVRVFYQRLGSCTANCVFYDNTVARSAAGQITTDLSTRSNRTHGYDGLGRLVRTREESSGYCSVRQYGYDANSNRTAKTELTGATCPTSGAKSWSSTYDNDRLVSTRVNGTSSGNVVYDPWGNIVELPASAGSGVLEKLGYRADGLLSSIDLGGTQTSTFLRDALSRVHNSEVTVGGAKTTSQYGYGDETDKPSWVATIAPNGTTAWSRSVYDPSGDIAAVAPSSGTATLQLASVRGDTVGEIDAVSGATTVRWDPIVDEFGIPRSTTTKRYGFLGAKARESVASGHLVQMGVRVYNPHGGRFLQTDPVLGGSANPYDYVGQDPVNKYDLDGQFCIPCGVTIISAGAKVYKVYKNARKAREARKRLQANKAKGDAGEKAVTAVTGIAKNTKRIDFDDFPNIPKMQTKSGYRVPDYLTDDMIGEVKNVKRLNYIKQIDDYIRYSKATNREFNLWVPKNFDLDKQVSGRMKKAIDAGEVIIKRIEG